MNEQVCEGIHTFEKRHNVKNDHNSSSKIVSATPKLRVPGMKCFTNCVRDYPHFKSKFLTYYEKHYGSHAVRVLKENLLTGYPKRMCSAAKTVDDVSAKLDSMFGDEGKLAEIVLADIENIEKCGVETLEGLKLIRDTVTLAIVDLSNV